jgi:hypothetical protein
MKNLFITRVTHKMAKVNFKNFLVENYKLNLGLSWNILGLLGWTSQLQEGRIGILYKNINKYTAI